MKIDAVRQFAMRLPDVTEAPHFNFSSFWVRGKIFVTIPPEETHVHVFVPEEVREPALIMHASFLEKLLWGAKTVGLRVTLRPARAAVVNQLIRQAWEYKAPKRARSEQKP